MNIKRFNKSNLSQREIGKASLYVHSAGNLCINEGTAALLGVTPTSIFYVEFIQDEDNPKDWYIMLSTEDLGLKLRKEKKKDKYNVNSGVLAKEILKTLPKSAAQTSPNTASLLISSIPLEHNGLKLFPILTSSYKPK